MINLINELKWFIEPHKAFVGTEEQIFTPREDIGIRLWFEGGLIISAHSNEIEINLNSINRGLLVLAIRSQENDRIIRVPIERFIAFELTSPKNSRETLDELLRLGGDKKN